MSVFFTDTDCEMSYVDAEALGMKVIGMPGVTFQRKRKNIYEMMFLW